MKKKSFLKRLLAVGTTVAMVVGAMSFSVMADSTVSQSDESAYVGYRVSHNGFNVYGLDNGNVIKTTYSYGETYGSGYTTTLKVGDSTASTDNNFAYGAPFSVGDVSATITADIDSTGKAVIVTYTVINNGASDQSVQLGTCADCQIGSDGDAAPVRSTGNGLSMEYGGNRFYLIPGGGNFTTRYAGALRGAQPFADGIDDTYTDDSGLAWSWSFDVPAGGSVTKTAYLAAGAELQTCELAFDGNGGTGTMSSVNYISGVSIDLPANEFTRDGYTFGGWTTTEGSMTVEYADGAQITLTADTTLYAVWLAGISSSATGYEGVYDGVAHGIDVSVTDPSSGATVMYGETDGTYDLTSSPEYTDIGTHTVYYQVSANGYTTLTGSADVVISPAIIAATATDYNGEYDGSGHGITVFVTDPASGATVMYGETEGTYDLIASPQYSTVGTHTVYYRVSANGYTTATGSATVTITPVTTATTATEATTTATEATTTTTTVATTTTAEATTTTTAPIVYNYTAGKDSTWTQESNDGLTFRAERENDGSNTFEHFTGVKVDDKELSSDNYTASNGSVIVTLKSDYLNTLSVGEHTLTLLFDDGDSITTTFTIKAASSVAATGESRVSTTMIVGGLLIATAAYIAVVSRTKKEEN